MGEGCVCKIGISHMWVPKTGYMDYQDLEGNKHICLMVFLALITLSKVIECFESGRQVGWMWESWASVSAPQKFRWNNKIESHLNAKKNSKVLILKEVWGQQLWEIISTFVQGEGKCKMVNYDDKSYKWISTLAVVIDA